MCHKAKKSSSLVHPPPPLPHHKYLNPYAPNFHLANPTTTRPSQPQPIFPHELYVSTSPPIIPPSPPITQFTSFYYYYPPPIYLGGPTYVFIPDPVSIPGKAVKMREKRFVPPRGRGSNVGSSTKWGERSDKFVMGQKCWGPGLAWKPKNKISDLASQPPSLNDDDDDTNDFKKTTVMLKNIPNQYSRNELLDFLDQYCREHKLAYDFAYLPMDFRRHSNLGYAFVNFTTPNAALKCHNLLNGYKWRKFVLGKGYFSSTKVCQVTWAKIQGKQGLVKHFKNSYFLCYKKEYLPVELSPPSKGDVRRSTLITVGSYWKSA